MPATLLPDPRSRPVQAAARKVREVSHFSGRVPRIERTACAAKRAVHTFSVILMTIRIHFAAASHLAREVAANGSCVEPRMTKKKRSLKVTHAA
jgi:hypothetical protein